MTRLRNADGPTADKVGRIVDRIEQLAGEIEPAMPGLAAELRRLAVADAPPMPLPTRELIHGEPDGKPTYRTLKDAAQAAATATFHHAGKVQRFGTQGDKALTKDELVRWYLAHWRRFPQAKPVVGR